MKIIYLGYLMPDKVYFENKVLSFAAGRFEKGLVQGLEDNNVFLEILSIEPREHNLCRNNIYIKRRKIYIDGVESQAHTIGYINIPFIKQMTLFINVMRQLLLYKIKHRREKIYLLTYNADVPVIQIGLLAEYLGIYFAPILSDLPFYKDHKKGNVSLTERLSIIAYKSQLKKLKNIKRVIVLNENVAKDFNIPRYVLVDGAINKEDLNDKSINIGLSKRVLYCGSLDIYHGSDKLVECIKKCPQIQFDVCGRGDEWKNIFKKLESEVHNLNFHGEVSSIELERLQEKASVMVIPHPTQYKQLRYQFPSKLLAYMSTGVPVITTPLPGITEDYDKYIIKSKDDSIESICKCINNFFDMTIEERTRLGRSAKEYVIKQKTWIIQSNKIINFLWKNNI